MHRKRRPERSLRGTLRPLLDLHGLTAGEAVPAAEAWLRRQQQRGERVVVIVTGRGNRSPGPPVLKHEIEHLLHRCPAELVAAWEPAEGGGAFQVRLAAAAPPPRAGPRPGARLRGVDPRLRAVAEESLAELGITPTPALLRAEIERLQRIRGESRED